VLNFAHGRRFVDGRITHFIALHCERSVTVTEIMAADARVGPYTYSSNIHVMHDSFGVDVARASIVRESSDVYGQSGNCIQSRHFHVVADSMIMFGTLQPCSSKGVRSVDDSVLRNASFEHTNEVITSSSAIGTVNDCNGPTDRIFTSRAVRCGSNYCGTRNVPYEAEATPLLIREQPPFAAVADETLRTLLVPNDLVRKQNQGDASVVPRSEVGRAAASFVPTHLAFLPRRPFAVARFHSKDTARVRNL
jgi:hypothetical protein